MTTPERIADELAGQMALSVPPDAAELADAGKRLAEAHDLALLCGGAGRWIAARLSDGGTDGHIYDRRDQAVRHQLHETQCAYVCVQSVRMPAAEAAQLIKITREAYDAGFRIQGPDDPRHIGMEGGRRTWPTH